MTVKWNVLNRKVHYWGSAIVAIPVLIIIVTGIILLFKKDVAWIQPPSEKGTIGAPSLTFEKILSVAKDVNIADVQNWNDIKRLDIRPKKGIIKIRTKSRWEIQIDHQSGAVLATKYRRSDVIESIHDGSFFHDKAKLWIFLPSAIILLILWITGMWLFFVTVIAKNKKKKKNEQKLKSVSHTNVDGVKA